MDPQTPQPTLAANPPPTIESPPSIQPSQSKFLTTIIVISLLVFPPIAWIIMLINKKYHSWFASQLIIFGLLFGLLTGIFAFTVHPKLASLYNQIGAAGGPNAIWLYMLLALCVSQIIFGVWLSKRNKSGQPISMALATISAAILIIDLIGFSSATLSYLSNIYNFTSQF